MRLIWIQLVLGLFQTDLAVKHEVDNNSDFTKERTFLNGKVRIKRLRNYGMAGGKLTGHMPALIRGSGVMTALSGGALLGLLSEEGYTCQKLGWSLLTGGALSNLYDRCRKGYVVDYVSFQTPWRKLSNLVFNLSDFFIFAGALLICLGQTDRAQR